MAHKERRALDVQKPDPMEYTINRPFTIEMILSIVTLTTLLILNYFFGEAVENLSFKITLALQRNIQLDYFSHLMSYGFFFGMYFYIFIIFLTRQNSESSFVLLFYSLNFQNIQNILKLYFRELRPLHYHSGMSKEYCFGVCDYGMPSGHTLCTAGLLFLIYYDIIRYMEIGKSRKLGLRIALIIVSFFIGFSRIYFGIHTLNQVILGYAFGATIYFVMARNEPWILKFIIWPLLFKDRFGSKSGIKNLLLVFFVSNVTLLSLWAYNYTYVEQFSSFFLQLRKCTHCMKPEMLEYHFSTKSVKESQIINLFYGMFLGIAIRDFKEFRYRGLYIDRSLPKFLLRFLILLIFMSPLLLMFHTIFKNSTIVIGQAMLISLIVGYGIMKWYLDLLCLVGLLPPVVFSQDEVSEKEEISREEELIQASMEFRKRSTLSDEYY